MVVVAYSPKLAENEPAPDMARMLGTFSSERPDEILRAVKKAVGGRLAVYEVRKPGKAVRFVSGMAELTLTLKDD